MKPTVRDIAARAGVSLATVDRVLNERPGVRKVTRERVEAAIEALGFVRDMTAANLATRRLYRMIFILPTNDNSFMQGLRAQVAEAAQRAAFDRISITIVDVPAFDTGALVAALDAVRAERPAGVALVAVDSPEVVEAVNRLDAEGIPAVTLVSDLSGSARVHYAGIDNVAAGRTAAGLLGRFLCGRHGSLAVLIGSTLVRDHRERLEGFRAVMRVEYPNLTVLPALEGRDDPVFAQKVVNAAFDEHKDIIGIYSLGAGNRGLLRALEDRRSVERVPVVVHELTDATRSALKDGLIDAVLNQDAGHEVRSAIRVLKAKADRQPIIEEQERIRLDIFLKDNMP